MTLEEAISTARANSKQGYVQHVNRAYSRQSDWLDYYVSDWRDSSTVVSFENGRQL